MGLGALHMIVGYKQWVHEYIPTFEIVKFFVIIISFMAALGFAAIFMASLLSSFRKPKP